MNKCKWFGHRWNYAYIKGTLNEVKIKFIGCYCMRCRKGEKELLDVVNKMETEYATYTEHFFDGGKNE